LGEGESVEDCALPRALVQVATEARGVLVAMAGFELFRFEPEIVRYEGQEARTVFVALRHADSCTEVLGRLVLDRGEA
jgi:hypothetical protein